MKDLIDRAADRLPSTDILALHRTILGNTRTLLSTIRTALTLFAVGVGFLRFLAHTFLHILGHMLLISAFISLFFGVLNYLYFRSKIRHIMYVELVRLEREVK